MRYIHERFRRFVAAGLAAAVFGMASASGCTNPYRAAAPRGADWRWVDLNKYGENYAPFPTSKFVIGMPRDVLFDLLDTNVAVVSMDGWREVLNVHRWRSIDGPDYIDEDLLLELVDGRLARWKIVKAVSQTTVQPRRW